MTNHVASQPCRLAFRIAARFSAAAMAAALLLGCVSTELQVGKDHPAHPAVKGSLPPVGSALDPDFEPQTSGLTASDGAADPHAGHDMSHPVSEEKGGQKDLAHGEQMKPEQDAPSDAKKSDAKKSDAKKSDAKKSDAKKSDAKTNDQSKNGSMEAAPQWTCPMHPEIVKPEPGNCPICGMKLKPKAVVRGTP